jgi:Uma2 family endonuclease
MAETTRVAQVQAHDEDPYQLGWRYIRHALPEGGERYEQVPLKPGDLLHPEEGDQMTHSRAHQRVVRYLTDTIEARFADTLGVVVLDDVRIAWDVAELRPHGPDVMVIFDVREVKNWSTFNVATEGTRPTLLFEITSPDTRENDLIHKLDHYEQAGVPYYLIVDLRQRGELLRPRLLGYVLTGAAYQPLQPDERGWLWLEPLRLWLGLEANEVYLYEEAGRRLGDYTEVVRALAMAELRAENAELRAEAEVQARTALAAQLEEEAQARTALAAQLEEEAQARTALAAQLEEEAQARTALAARLEAVERELERRRAEG